MSFNPFYNPDRNFIFFFYTLFSQQKHKMIANIMLNLYFEEINKELNLRRGNRIGLKLKFDTFVQNVLKNRVVETWMRAFHSEPAEEFCQL